MNEGEKRVVSKMILLYCRDKHGSVRDLCSACSDLSDYALMRLERCPFGDNKPTCGICPVHCYKAEMRESIRKVMRYAGGRMILRHPIDTIYHFYKEYKRKKLYPITERNSNR